MVAWVAGELAYVIEGLFEKGVCTLDLEHFKRTTHHNYKLMKSITEYIHAHCPEANNGKMRNLDALYLQFQLVLFKHYKLSRDELGFRKAEEIFGVNYYDIPDVIPAIFPTPTALSIAPLRALLQLHDTRIVEQTLPLLSAQMITSLFQSVGTALTKHLSLPPDFFNNCLSAAHRCKEEKVPNLVNTVASVLVDKRVKLETMLFYFTYYNWNFFLTSAGELQQQRSWVLHIFLGVIFK